ncbi:MAG: hypothetical protein MR362_11010 [Hallerella sp.]|uniref:hypothetical protein n=2 Tax=Hallerella TaxID=2815788 RepID=UPI0011B1FDB5|nr:hypothetical protein [Hallerella sp.]MCI5601809.1 hypothetical protein [Hallerella sp.]
MKNFRRAKGKANSHKTSQAKRWRRKKVSSSEAMTKQKSETAQDDEMNNPKSPSRKGEANARKTSQAKRWRKEKVSSNEVTTKLKKRNRAR